MVISFDSHSVTLFALFSVLWSQGSGFPAVDSDPSSRIKRQSDEFFTQEYTKMLAQLSARKSLKSLIGNSRKRRHTDGLLMSEHSKMLGKLSAKEFLNSLLGNLISSKMSDSANLSDTEPPGED